MANKKLLYLAGPYSSEPEFNTHKAIKVAGKLSDMGYVVFVPHLSHYWDKIDKRNYEWWMSYDFEILSRCDLLVRMPGESSGADREVAFAIAHNIPHFTLEEFLEL